jgi:hypothetical protein
LAPRERCEKEDSANPQQNSRNATANHSPSIGDFIGTLVVHSIAKSVSLDQIGVLEIKRFSSRFDDDVGKIFDVRCSLAQRRSDRRPVTCEYRVTDQKLAQTPRLNR